MRYEEFRDHLQNVLCEAGLFFLSAGSATETIDPARTSRRWEGDIRRVALPEAEPFHVSAKVTFDWSAVNAARASTCEEDLLTELLGRKQRYPKTQRRWVRVDLALRGMLPYGSLTPVPDLRIFGPWASSVSEKLGELFYSIEERQGRIVAVTGGREEVTVEARSSADGVLFLRGVSASGFRLVPVSRVWDDPARQRTEKDNARQLVQLAELFRNGIDEWSRSIADLARWIRYSPPLPGTKPAEPWFEDEDENEDPETIH